MLKTLASLLLGWPTLILILAAGAWFSYQSAFYQLLHPLQWLRTSLCPSRRGRSRFRALSTALAGSIGTGNILGVAAALTAGGPGALFWMSAAAVLGMMTVYVENYLSAKYRGHTPRDPRRVPAGPLRYMERAGRFGGGLALVYALACGLSSLCMGNMAQMNALAAACGDLGLPILPVALGAGALVFFVARGGLRTAARVAEKLVPAMTLIFFTASLCALWVNRANLPGAVGAVFRQAFSLRAGAGGAAGMLIAMRAGVARGVFTNEAGLGSSAFAYEEAREHSPEELGRLGIFQVFADTVVMCTITGLCILSAFPGGLPGGQEGAQVTFAAYRAALGQWGGVAVNVCTILFALATVTAWSCYGREAAGYLTGGRFRGVYPVLAAAAAVVGCFGTVEAVLYAGDAANGLMALPNLIALAWAVKESKAQNAGAKCNKNSAPRARSKSF